MPPPRRTSAAANDTREAILDAAERLFARDGVEGVSLRQIGAAAGSSNHFAVQYYFGDRAQLVRAIFERRLPALEVRRVKLLGQARSEGRYQDVRALMEVMLRPLAEEVDADGRCSYAAFLLGLYDHGSLDPRSAAADLAPVTAHLAELLFAAATARPSAMARTRLTSAFVLFLHAVRDWDRAAEAGRAPPLPSREAMIEDAVDLAAAVYAAPVRASVLAALEPASGG